MLPFEVLLPLMDWDLREKARLELPPRPVQDVLDRYMQLHRERHGGDFLIGFSKDEDNVVYCKVPTQDGCIVVRPVPTELAIHLMMDDKKLIKQVEAELGDFSPQTFIDRFTERFREKHGKEFIEPLLCD